MRQLFANKSWLWIAILLFYINCIDGQQNQFISFTNENGLASNSINCLEIGPNGKLWIGTNGNGLVIFDGTAFSNILDKGYFIEEFIQDFNEGIFLKSEVGIFRFNGFKWTSNEKKMPAKPLFPFADVEALKNYTITAFETGDLGDFWLSTSNKGLVVFQSIDSTVLEISKITDFANATYRFLTDVAIDQNGNVWVSSKENGIAKYMGERYQIANENSAGIGVFKTYLDNADRIILLDENHQLSTYPKILDSILLVNLDWQNDKSVDILINDDENTFILSEQGKITQIDNILLNSIQRTDTFNFEGKCLQLKRDATHFYVLTEKELYQISFTIAIGESIPKLISIKIPSSGISVNEMHIDKKNRLWVRSNDHLGYLKNGKIEWIKTPQKIQNITCWFEDKQGVLWIGTSNAGIFYLSMYDNDILISPLEKPFLNAWPRINNIMLDGEKIFMTDRRVLYQLEYSKNQNKIISWQQVSKIDGFPDVSITPNTIIQDRSNSIFVGSDKGLLRLFDSGVNNSNPEKINEVILENFLINSIPIYETEYSNEFQNYIENKSPLKLKPNDNNLSFRYSINGLKYNKKLMFQWRINASIDWSNLSEESSIQLANLAPGKYTIEIRSCTVANQCGPSFKLPLEIAAPFYKTIWFYLLCILGVILILSLIFWLRLQRAKRALNAQKELLEMEAKALKLERKALQLQMNPHFIFNAINSIQNKIKPDSVIEAKSYLAKFSRLMRKVLESSRQNYILLEDEIELLENYAQIAGLSHGVDVVMQVKIDQKIDPETFEIPSMILQPFIENSIQHGFNGKTIGQIDLSFTLKGRNLLISIQDDGIGFSNEKKNYTSISTDVIKDRLKLLPRPGKVEVLQKNNTSIAGTAVLITLPIEKEFNI